MAQERRAKGGSLYGMARRPSEREASVTEMGGIRHAKLKIRRLNEALHCTPREGASEREGERTGGRGVRPCLLAVCVCALAMGEEVEA